MTSLLLYLQRCCATWLHELTMWPTSIHLEDNRGGGGGVEEGEVEGFFHPH
jgi:hypothetical protein